MKKIKEILKKYNLYLIIIASIIIYILIINVEDNKEEKNIIEETKIEVEENQKKEIKIYKVDIKGNVKNPGIYELNENDRVSDVIKKAGGLTKNADTSVINLSKKIKDEMVIIIYSNEEVEKLRQDKKLKEYEPIKEECICPININDACIQNEEKINNDDILEEKNIIEETKLININTATKDQLLTISGIGESKAISIINYREETKFNSIDEIKNVSGIGESLFEKIKTNITV